MILFGAPVPHSKNIYIRGIAGDDHICHPDISTVIPMKTATPDAKAFKLVVSQRFLFLIALDVAPAHRPATH